MALEEGHKRMIAVLSQKRKEIMLGNIFEELRKDSSVWVQYDPDWRNIFEQFYLNEPDHWKSIMWKFQGRYGAQEFDKEDLARSHSTAGKIAASDLYELWKHECVDLSSFCKNSELREPPIKPTQCGACR